MLNFHSIKFRIIALGIALIMVGVFARQFVALPMIQEHLRDLVAAQQLSIATYVARDVDYSITSRLNLIERLAADLPPDLTRQPEGLRLWFKRRHRINPLFNGGMIAVKPDGHGVFADFPSLPTPDPLDFSTSDWLQAALQQGKPVMGKPVHSRATNNPIIVFAAPVRDDAGAIVMLLAGVVRLNSAGFLDRLQETRLGATGGFLLISPADKLFVASSDPTMVLKPTPLPGMNLLHDRAMAGYRGTGITVNAAGVEELSAMVSVPSAGWFVVARMPTAEAFSLVERLRGFMYSASLYMLIFTLCVLLIMLPRILRPLTDAATAMHAMAKGERKIEALAIVRDDEVGKLVIGFNVLVEKLAKEEEARRASEERLQYLAHHDSLTGLYNRAMLEDRLEQGLARAERDGTQIALLFCDLDGFKTVNDLHGHDAGDAVLRQVARRLSDGRRKMDTVARLGGDEFVVLLAGLNDAHAAAETVARQCLAAMEEAFEIEGMYLSLGISIGIALHRGLAVTPSYLLSQADIAMYQAKRKGKGHFFFMEGIGAPVHGLTPLARSAPD